MRRHIEVWFYIGVLLGIYGIILFLAGVYQWLHPPATVLASQHATFWAGCVLLLVGGGYTIGAWPKPGRQDGQPLVQTGKHTT